MDKALLRMVPGLAASWLVYVLALLPALTVFGLLYAQPWLPMATAGASWSTVSGRAGSRRRRPPSTSG